MKILQVNKFFYRKGGAEQYFFDVSTALEEAGHEVVHFSMEDERNLSSPYSDYFIRNIDFTKKKTIGKGVHYVYSMEAMEMMRRLIKATKPDVAHLHNIAHHLTPSILVALRNAGVPVVQTLHDYQLICPNYKLFTQGSPCERCFKKKYWNAIKFNCVQDSKASSTLAAFEMGFHNILLKANEWGVSRFIAPSQFLQTKLLDWGWQQPQITHLPHFTEKKRDTTIKKKRQVLYAGRLVEEKGVDVLLDAAKECEDVDIVIAGAGPLRTQLEAQQAKLQLTNVRFIGHQETAQLDRLIQESAAVVVPSRWYENAPLNIYESLALGTPVIGAKHGGIVELISEGKNGLFFQPGNAHDLAQSIKKLFNNSVLRIGENQYTKEKHINALLPLYEDVMQKKLRRIPL